MSNATRNLGLDLVPFHFFLKSFQIMCSLVLERHRYQHDPNPRVREGMTNIWRLLVSEPRRAVDEHFRPILAELLREMGGRLWRNREAAALATADLLQGRRWAEVKDSLAEIWAMAFRTLDDIKVLPLP